MTATLPKPRPLPSTALGLWWLVSIPVRLALRATVPLDARQHGCGSESLIVAVGTGCPVRWLQVAPLESGELDVRLWEVRRTGTKQTATAVSTAPALPALLLKWAKEHGLSG